MCAGANFNAVRCADGRVFTFGLDDVGQLGRPVPLMRDEKTDAVDVEGTFKSHLAPAQPLLQSTGLPVTCCAALGAGFCHLLV